MPYVVVWLVGLVVCALEFLGSIGWLGLELGLVFGCMSRADMICKYVYVCVCSVDAGDNRQ